MVIQYKGMNYYWSLKKFLVNILIITLIISFWMFYVSNIARATNGKKVVEITVRRGDTLWSIAQRVAPDSDPRAVIKHIKTRNRLQDSGLISGQRLEIELVNNI